MPTTHCLEMASRRLFERIRIRRLPIDLHDYGASAIPFAFRDPVLYRTPRDKVVAQKLQKTVGAMLDALGLTVVNEYVSDEYLKMSLHRSVSGAALNTARIPAVTVEIGGQRMVNVVHVQAVVTGIRNGALGGDVARHASRSPAFRWSSRLPGAAHHASPRAPGVHRPASGQPGDTVRAGDHRRAWWTFTGARPALTTACCAPHTMVSSSACFGHRVPPTTRFSAYDATTAS